MNHDQLRELIPAYALGALERLEAQQIEDHLAQCPECQAELRAYNEVVQGLALGAPQVEPPPALKRRILEQAGAQAHRSKGSQLSLRPSGAVWINRLALAWGLISLVLVFLLAVSNFLLWQRLKTLETAGNFRLVALQGTEQIPEASGVLVISSDGLEGTLVVEHLPELDPQHQYQLWLIQNGQRTNGGVFSVTPEGYAHLAVNTTVSLLSFDSFGVTIEPAGGSPLPTGAKVLGGDL